MKVKYTNADYITILTILAAAWCYPWGAQLFEAWALPLFAALYLGANFLYIRLQTRPIPKESLVYAGFVLIASLQPALCDWLSPDDSIAVQFGVLLALLYHAAGIYFILVLNRRRMNHCLNEDSIIDLLRGLFVIPFLNFGRMILAAAAGLKLLFTGHSAGKHTHSDRLIQILIGIVLGCLVLLIAIPLLMAADTGFSDFIHAVSGNMSHFFIGFSGIFRIENIFMVLIAFYLYGLTYGAGKARVPTLPQHKPALSLAAFISQLIICGLYLLFFIVKLVNTVTTLSHGQGTFSYSGYARAGFFELCRIAFLNVLIFYMIRYMADRKQHRIRILSTILCAETLAFIVLAFCKMGLYISQYGFTFKRLLTSWFMIVLFVGFVLFIIKTWRSFNAFRITVIFGAISFLALSYWSFISAYLQLINI